LARTLGVSARFAIDAALVRLKEPIA